eukprot:TRINITY_DN4546_c0_g1_i4.p1 TRINITY_DN4546_c0_g1~~TRINITY_DN4546_c0_g1_i4.p1  ORF type:complete len:286 (-),score=27.44 TRINITY_DN4546_c0_g1_i4:367-1224(-)
MPEPARTMMGTQLLLWKRSETSFKQSSTTVPRRLDIEERQDVRNRWCLPVLQDAENAELLLMPYDYLINPQTRESLQIQLEATRRQDRRRHPHWRMTGSGSGNASAISRRLVDSVYASAHRTCGRHKAAREEDHMPLSQLVGKLREERFQCRVSWRKKLPLNKAPGEVPADFERPPGQLSDLGVRFPGRGLSSWIRQNSESSGAGSSVEIVRSSGGEETVLVVYLNDHWCGGSHSSWNTSCTWRPLLCGQWATKMGQIRPSKKRLQPRLGDGLDDVPPLRSAIGR